MPLVPIFKGEWATNNPNDPGSGQDAIIEPSGARQKNGYTNQERPDRQSLNWIGNIGVGWGSAAGSMFRDFINGFRIQTVNFNGVNDYGISLSDGVAASIDGAWIFDSKVDGGWNVPVGFRNFRKKLNDGGTTSWFVGENQSGLSSSLTLTNNTWYHIFVVITNTDTIDVGFDTAIDGANLIVDHAIKFVRRVGSIFHRLPSNGIQPVKQFGDYFFYDPQDSSTAVTLTSGTPENDIPLGLFPIGIFTFAKLSVFTEGVGLTGTNIFTLIAGEGETLGNPASGGRHFIADTDSSSSLTALLPMIGTSPELRAKAVNITGGSLNVRVMMEGYFDLRGRDWGSGPTDVSLQGVYY